ncbi:hypothetical protein C8Q79DRAFT_791561 [Trametes meyenii]|nr:hypothetical protein C8Q79DRAFT_791561 [Trametes meyenii]
MSAFTPVFDFEDLIPIPSSPTRSDHGSPSGDNVDSLEHGTGNESTHSASASRTTTPTLDGNAHQLCTTSQGQQRRAEDAFDLTQDADWAARRVRLKPADADTLRGVAQLSPSQREFWTNAMLLKIRERLEIIIPADAQWTMSENLKDKIEHYVFIVLCSPVLPDYVNKKNNVKLVANILACHPSWGYTKEVQDDKYKRNIVLSRIGTQLTDRRSDIKEVVSTSSESSGIPRSDSALTHTNNCYDNTVLKLSSLQPTGYK